MISIKRVYIVLSLSLLSYSVSGQTENPYEIIRLLAKEMNSKYPIVDSLYPFAITNFSGKDWNILTNKEKKSRW